MDFHLPDWPARRLVVEAAIAWGYRHLDEEPIDPYTSPWPKMRRAVLAFLRHQLSDYDSRLCARCEHDQAYRDELAEQIAEAACREYPWLNSDPRPFSAAESQDDVPLLDSFAKELSNLISIRNHLASAIKDLKRTGCAGEQLGALQQEMTRIDHQIRELYGFLTKPKTGTDAVGGYSRSFTLSRENKERQYYFYTSVPLPTYRIDYVGVKCPRCGASVARAKQLISLGQGYNRVAVWSCHCLTYAAHQPLRVRLEPITAAQWASAVQASAKGEQ
jgi:hypothetical protein